MQLWMGLVTGYAWATAWRMGWLKITQRTDVSDWRHAPLTQLYTGIGMQANVPLSVAFSTSRIIRHKPACLLAPLPGSCLARLSTTNVFNCAHPTLLQILFIHLGLEPVAAPVPTVTLLIMRLPLACSIAHKLSHTIMKMCPQVLAY